jgi:hypothetical protein
MRNCIISKMDQPGGTTVTSVVTVSDQKLKMQNGNIAGFFNFSVRFVFSEN